jgi:hypothetical protein
MGWLSMGLLVIALAAFGVFFGFVISGEKGGAGFFSNARLSAAILVATISAIGGGVAGLSAVVHEGERAWLVIVAVALGALVAAYTTVELVVPH